MNQSNQVQENPTSLQDPVENTEQQNNQNSTDWSSGIDPVDLVELVVELGKDALDVVGGALENIDISF